jgi:outer membrane protein OmpA-like peptidoglycan-associated protein
LVLHFFCYKILKRKVLTFENESSHLKPSLKMKANYLFLLPCFILPNAISNAQKVEELGRVQPFLIGLKGTVYKFTPPQGYKLGQTLGYTQEIEKTSPVGFVYTQSLNITERELEAPFPGVPKNISVFAIIYKGQFAIKDSAEYEFILKSDDGSRLWIDSTEVINHDGIHQFSIPKKGSKVLSSGFHSMKVWYFQGMANRMGLLLLMRKLGEKEFKPFDLKPLEEEAKKYMKIENGKAVVNFNDKLLFDVSKFDVKPEANDKLNEIVKVLVFNPKAKVRIEGHTDNVGSAVKNQLLSENRAKAVEKALKDLGLGETVVFQVKGLGLTQPIADNATEEGRSKNRRVEIYIETE